MDTNYEPIRHDADMAERIEDCLQLLADMAKEGEITTEAQTEAAALINKFCDPSYSQDDNYAILGDFLLTENIELLKSLTEDYELKAPII